LVNREVQVHLVHLGTKERSAHQVPRESEEELDHEETLVHLDLEDHEDHLVLLAQ